MRTIGIYVHIPFCLKKCNYCDFLSFSLRDEDEYTKSLVREIDEFDTDYLVETVFFGGGTPSIISTKNMAKIISKLREKYRFAQEAELSIELNPATFDEEVLRAYQKMGINRLSIGLQSTDDELLRVLGRAHTYKEFLQGYETARKLGFSNINVDLMAGLPRQTLEKYVKSLYDIIKLRPDHISSYGLIIEEETPFFEWYNESGSKFSQLPQEEEVVKMYESTKDILKSYGYERYEISNYAKPGYECRHNLRYWNRKSYKGFGLGAASCLILGDKEVRTTGNKDFHSYNLGYYIGESESLCAKDIFNEIIFLGLRLTRGIDIKKVYERYNIDIKKEVRKDLDSLKSEGLIEEVDGCIRLTNRGLELSNYVMMTLIKEED